MSKTPNELAEKRRFTQASFDGRPITDEEIDIHVDAEVRDVIRLLNKIPFLETKFCCAGYGEVESQGRDHGSDIAYIVIAYKGMGPRVLKFHMQMSMIADNLAYFPKHWMSTPDQFAYYLTDDDVEVFKKGPRYVQNINRRKWAAVRKLAEEYQGN